MARRQYKTPFAVTGDVVSVPDAVQPDGSVSLQQGFGFDYQRDPNTDPLAKVFPRDVHNGILNEITASIGEIQQQGYPIWVAAGAPYPINAVVRHNDVNWQSDIATNNDEPGVGAGLTSWKNISEVEQSSLPPGYFSGFALANDGVSPNTTISVSAGAARSSSNTVDVKLTSPILGILQSAGAWAAGDNQNKLDTGARANNSTYHVFTIRRTSDGAGDILFSLSATTPTMPSGYAGFRRVGRIATDSGGNIRRFKARGDGRYDWVTPRLELTQVSVGGGSSLITLSGFGGSPCDVYMQAAVSGDSAILRITASDQTDNASILPIDSWTGGVIANNDNSTVDGPNSFAFQVNVDSSGQVRLRTSSASGGNLTNRAYVFGWKEFL